MEISHWINGADFQDEGVNRFGDVYNPARGEVTGRVAMATSETVDRAVQAAEAAFPAWSATSTSKRAQIMHNYRELLRSRADDILDLVVAEHGKTREDAAGALARAIETVEVCCSAPLMLKGEFSEQVGGGIDIHMVREPLGVCVGITPFNFPAMIPIFMFSVAIASGNTFVLKPSERVPSASLLLAELLEEAGVPAGVLNVVQGDKVAVDALLDHEDVKAVSFIGSTPIAKYVYERSAASGKRVQAFGGAKNHMVVLPDADLDQAADALISAAYGSAGQRCMAVTTAVAVGGCGDELVAKTKERIGALTVAPGWVEGSDMGPLITREAKDRVAGYIDRGAEAGAELVADGRGIAVDGFDDGFFVGPTLFDRVTTDMELYRDEIFGPVLIVLRADSFEEALNVVRTNPYGNGAAIYTGSGQAARRFQQDVPTGTVGVNVPIPFPVCTYGFGGWGESRFGDRGINADAFHFYTQQKVISSRWPESVRTGVDMGFLSQA